QFMHRMVAYLLWILSVLWVVHVLRHVGDRGIRLFAYKLAAAVTIQAAIGILTLLHQVPISLALLHQAMAIAVLTIATVQAARLLPQPERQRIAIAAEQGT